MLVEEKCTILCLVERKDQEGLTAVLDLWLPQDNTVTGISPEYKQLDYNIKQNTLLLTPKAKQTKVFLF